MTLSFNSFKDHTVQLAYGWGKGETYANSRMKERMFKQGSHHLIAAVCQIPQMFSLFSVGYRLAENLPLGRWQRSVKILCLVAPFASIPYCLLSGIAASGNTPRYVDRYTARALRFSYDYLSEIARVALLAGSIALFVLGQRSEGGAIFLALAYEKVDSLGYIPRKISLFVEKYLSLITPFSQLIKGNVTEKIFYTITISTTTSSSMHRYLQAKIDYIYRKATCKTTPGLSEVDAPVIERTQLTFDQIQETLNRNHSEFKVNLRHAARSVTDIHTLPENTNLNLLLTLYNRVNWNDDAHQRLIYLKLKDDERFKEFIQKKLAPEKSLDQIGKEFDSYLASLSAEANCTQAEYMVNWLNTQMGDFVKLLKDEIRVQGYQQELEDAISDCYKITAYLDSLNPENRLEQLEIEDILLKLAIEGGNYCSLGIKRATAEVVRQIVQNKCQALKENDHDADYKKRLLAALQEMRIAIFQDTYKHFVGGFKETMRVGDVKNVHLFEQVQRDLGLGFYPLTPQQRHAFGLADFLNWEMNEDGRLLMYEVYRNQMDAAIQELTEVEFGTYLNGLIQSNPQLSEEQKEQIINIYVDCNDGNWSLYETQKKFHNLVFYMLGVTNLQN